MNMTNTTQTETPRARAIAWRLEQLAKLPVARFRDDPSGEYTAQEKREYTARLRASLQAQMERIEALPDSATMAEVLHAVVGI